MGLSQFRTGGPALLPDLGPPKVPDPEKECLGRVLQVHRSANAREVTQVIGTHASLRD
jgi:hypothetical protein